MCERNQRSKMFFGKIKHRVKTDRGPEKTTLIRLNKRHRIKFTQLSLSVPAKLKKTFKT